ncbi:hypothetical protein Tco_1025975, partial [Tanacetum coccineum]
ASAKLTRAELNKRSGDGDLSKDKSGPESPPEFRRSWYQLGDEGPSFGGTKLSLTFITAEVTFTKPKQPTVDSFEELSQKFLEEFSQQKRYAKDPTEIHGIKRRQNEGLQAFMDRFKSESSHIKGVPLVLRISAFMHGHGHPELAKKLNDKIPKTVDEMFERVRAFIRGEVAVGSAEMVRPSQGDKGNEDLKSGFFLIDQRAILDAMVWRHSDAAIDDPRPCCWFLFNVADVRCHDRAKVQEEPHLDLPLVSPSSRFIGDDDESDDDDACVEISLVTPLHSAAVIPSSRNQGGNSVAPTTEGSNTRGKLLGDVSGDAIHTDFFPFSAGPYYANYPEDGVSGNCEFTREERDAPYRPTFRVLTKEDFKDPAVCNTIVDQFPTPREMVRVRGLSNDQLTTKMSVLHCMMMSHDGELLARYRGLNQFHHEYVLSTDSRLKGYEERVADLIGLELQVSTLKKKKKIKSLSKSLDNLHYKVARLSAALNQAAILEAERDEEILLLKATPLKFSSFFRGQFQAASAGFECELSMHLTKDEFANVLKKMVNFMPGAQERLAEASSLVAQTDNAFLNKISKYAVEPLSVILQLELEKLVRPAIVPIPKDTRVSPPIAKESTVTPVSKSLELSANVVPASSVIALEQNEEKVSVAVDGSDLEMTDGAAHSKSGGERVSSALTDVVVALSAGEKGDGSAPSSTVEEVVVPPFGV